jgi:hypothetical protein
MQIETQNTAGEFLKICDISSIEAIAVVLFFPAGTAARFITAPLLNP